MSRSVRDKLSRLRAGERARVLDLFSGCGGLFLGFHRAGANSVAGVELDPLAARSFAVNFHGGDERHAAPKDITTLDPHVFLQKLGHAQPRAAVDLIVGGPPCPTFTRVGRAKLREVRRHPEAYRHDPRAKLYLPYLRFVAALEPVALVMENVPDLLNFGGHNLGEEICESLEELGYVCQYSLLNAACFGAPQLRERWFLMAIHESADQPIPWPIPSRTVDFPAGYDGSRKVALQQVLPNQSRYVEPKAAPPGAPPPVTAEEALADLPPITLHLQGRDRRGARRFDRPVGYQRDAIPSSYARALRDWPGFAGDGQIRDHVTRCLSDRDYRIFARMKAGDQYPEAHALALRLWARATGSDERRRAEYVPPYDPSKFPNKWRKMEPDLPARTLMAHLGKDGYSHIHYDSAQARVISVREAARLQSFPDGFRFCGTMNPAFRQIGNSVPPLLSFALAAPLLGALAQRDSSLTVGPPATGTVTSMRLTRSRALASTSPSK
jgi:DNA (cytosine-5)-methyltransferase 1